MSFKTHVVAINSIIQDRIADQTISSYHPNLAGIAAIDPTQGAGQVLAIDPSGSAIIAAPTAPNATTADSLSVARNLSLTGDVLAQSGLWDGSADLNMATTLASTGIVAGTYSRVAVDEKGRVTDGSNPVITGEVGQIAVTGGDGSIDPVIALADNPIIPGTGAVKVPAGTDLERPDAPVLGMQRYNTFHDQFEFFQGNQWVPYVPAVSGGGSARANISDNIEPRIGTEIIPFIDTPPTLADGAELFSVTLTPYSILSRFAIAVNFTVDSSANQRSLAGALFRNATCISVVAMTTSQSGKLSIFSILATDEPQTTSPVTYSVRFGGESSMTWYINSSTAAVFGGALSGNGWQITELT